MKKLKWLLAAVLAANLILPLTTAVVMAENASEPSETDVLKRNGIPFENKYGFKTTEKNPRKNYEQVSDNAPTRWQINNTEAYCINMVYTADATRTYKVAGTASDRFGEDRGYLIAAYAYYGSHCTEIDQSADRDLYYTAAQFLIWDETNGPEGTGYTFRNTDEEDLKKLKQAKEKIRERVESDRTTCTFTSTIYESPKRYGQPIVMVGEKQERQPNQNIVLSKYLIMSLGAKMPEKESSEAYGFKFEFEINGAAVEPSETAEGLNLYSGNESEYVSGMPVIQPVYMNHSHIKKAEERNNDLITEDQKYAQGDILVDFSNVTFHRPGLFRYVIKEKAANQKGIVNDKNSEMVLDVFVQKDKSYVIKNSTDFALYTDPSLGKNGKPPGFMNHYNTHNLELAKVVTGNQASGKDVFEFNVTLHDLPADIIYDVDLTRASASIGAHTNPAQINSGSGGTVNVSFWLRGGESVSIIDMSEGVTYAIQEALNNTGYRVSAAVEGDSSSSANGNQVNGTLNNDVRITFTNERTGEVPTGLRVSLWPVSALAAALGILMILKRKKKH